MKKRTIIVIAIAAALILFGICLSIAAVLMGAQPKQLFSDGSFTINVNDIDDIDDIFEPEREGNFGERDGSFAQRPSAAEAEVSEGESNYSLSGEISTVKIDWVSGSVKIVKSAGDTISFSESASGGIEKDEALVYSVDGNTLNISCCEGFNSIGFAINTGCIDKELVLSIPVGLRNLRIETTSAYVDISDLGLENELYVSTTSGDVNVSSSECVSVSLNSTSGKLDFSGSCADIHASTISGKISFSGSCGEFEADSTSGKVEAAFLSMPREIDADTVSGAVHFGFPADASFELEYDTVSGGLDCDFPVSMRDGDYHVGTGGAEINVDTVSGGLKIESK